MPHFGHIVRSRGFGTSGLRKFRLARMFQSRRHGGHDRLQRFVQIAGLPSVDEPNVERQGKVGYVDDRDLIPQRARAERGTRPRPYARSWATLSVET